MVLRITKSDKQIPGVKSCSAPSLYSLISQAHQIENIELVSPSSFKQNHFEIINLNGLWKRQADYGNLFDNPSAKDYDDFNLNDVFVPNNYGLEGALQRHFKPVWYRRKFQIASNSFLELHFSGVDYLSEVWLNGSSLGTHEGYFAPFYFDITTIAEPENVLVVKVTDPCENLDPQGDWISHRKKYIKGTMNYHDSRPGGLPGKMSPRWHSEWGQSLTTGGITQGVFLKQTGYISIMNIFITTLEFRPPALIHVAIILNNKASNNLKTTVNLKLIPPINQEISQAAIQAELKPGANRIDLEMQIPAPILWFPYSTELEEIEGRPYLYQLNLQTIYDEQLSDELTTPFGIRTVQLDVNPWKFSINDEYIFIKAVNYIPRQHFADVDVAFYRRDMNLIKEAHLNSVGVHAHVQCRDCYTATDKEGLLVFQDFPLQWSYDSSVNSNPSFREKACQQISEMVYFLYNHPSVVYLCSHNEPPSLFIPNNRDEVEDYDNQVLDELLEQSVKEIENYRPVHRASGLGDDLHIYDGSLMGGSIYSARKRKSGFVSEFGFWSIAETARKWGDIGWPPSKEELVQWSSRCSFFGSTSTFIGHPKYYSSRNEWVMASLLYGAFLAKYCTEIFRSQKANPYNAIRWHFFADWWGYAGGGLVDVDRVPKLPYYWYKEACRPLLLIADLINTIYKPGTEIEIPIIAVNDYSKKINIKWEYELLEVNGSRIIAGDPGAAILGGTGAQCVSRHKIAIPLEEPDVIKSVILNNGILTLPPNAATKIDILKFLIPKTEKNPSYLIQIKWTSDDKTESNWAHFMVGDLKAKMKPGLHIIRT